MTIQPAKQSTATDDEGQKALFEGIPKGNASGKCRVCGRYLKNPVSRAKGIGPVCAKKEAANQQKDEAIMEPDYFPTIPNVPIFDGKTTDVVWKRDGDFMDGGSVLRTNVRSVVTWHSPTGFEVGFPGSGPADFALNILAMCIPYAGTTADAEEGRISEEDTPERPNYLVTLNGIKQFASAFAVCYHQDFKRQFIASQKNRNEGRIPIADILTFVKEKLADMTEIAGLGASAADLDPADLYPTDPEPPPRRGHSQKAGMIPPPTVMI